MDERRLNLRGDVIRAPHEWTVIQAMLLLRWALSAIQVVRHEPCALLIGILSRAHDLVESRRHRRLDWI